ncbi:MAG TPA: PepSY-associated TM helix domain-containing protein [Sandaracinaceae bacterium LLY-WYZ-13_1]|nr:PepSY-associated TM helix domain-containing protein [Sandaracinaceae bacterium LLY-WYZ-13_1]
MSTHRPRRRLYGLHRWVGLLLAPLGLLVFFSGTVATFHEELDAWAMRGHRIAPAQDVPGFDLDDAHRVAAAGVPRELRRQVDISQQPGHPLRFFFHVHEQRDGAIVERGVAVDVDPTTLEVLRRRLGERGEALAPSAPGSLSSFFVDLHIFLLMPETLGLIATGIAGFALLLLVATGALVHRPTLRRLRRRPRTGSARQLVGDLHTLIGSWTLPFTGLLALTGSFLSFAGAVLLPLVAQVAFEGDQEAMFRTLIGRVEVSDSRDEASLAPLLDDAVARSSGGRVQFVALDQWGEEGANATFGVAEPSPFGDTSHHYAYDGHTGALVREKPAFGVRPSFGGSLVDLVARLHFGTLFGLVTKALWGVLGLATCALALLGLAIFTARRRDRRSPAARAVRSMTVGLGGGLPLGTASAGWTWAIASSLDGGDVTDAMTVAFLLALAAAAATGVSGSVRSGLVRTWIAAGVALAILPVLAPLGSGMGPFEAWSDRTLRWTVWVDAAFVVAGVALLVGSSRLARGWPRRRHPEVAPEESTPLGVGRAGPL